METCATADNCNNFCVIGHPGCKKNHGDKNQDRHKGQNEVQNPVWIKIQKKITNRESVTLNPRCFGLDINHQNNNRQ